MPAGRKPHSINGKLAGVWYETDAGTKLYLAHRRQRDIHKHSWLLEESILKKAQEQGCEAIGVVCRIGGQKRVYLTLIADFYDSPHSFPLFDGFKKRGLPLVRFRIDPARSEAIIARSVRLR